jgi:phospholipase C
VISPFSRGGHIATETFDHTSQLQLVAERFGVEVPNVSAWRKKTVGNLTSALFAGTYSTAIPALPAQTLPAQQLTGACSAVSQDSEAGGADPSVPTDQTMPNQQGGTTPASASTTDFVKGGVRRTVLGPAGPRPVTTKSSYNRLAEVRV